MTQAGRTLLRLMGEQGIKNPNQLAKAMGNKKYQVSAKRIIDGTTKEPKKSSLQDYAKFFSVNVDVFFTSDTTALATIESNISPILSSGSIKAQKLSKKVELLSENKKLSDEQVESVERLIDSFIKD